MTSTSKRLLVAVLAVVLTLSVATLGITAFAVTTTDTIEYPFAKGDNAFKYAPTWQGAENADTYKSMGDVWQFFQIKFAKNLNLDDFDYLAIQIKTTGNPGLTVGGINPANSGRYDNASVDGSTFYLLSEDGTITELSTKYSAINLGVNAYGTLILPKNQMTWRWNSDTQAIYCVYFTTNAQYNYAFSLTVGEIGYYKGEPTEGNFTKLIDLSKGYNKDNYYTGNAVVNGITFPSEDNKENTVPETMEYPFAKGDKAFDNAVVWAGTASKDTENNWQTLKVNFDKEADLSNATWLAVQYSAKTGTPGITYGVQNGDARYSISGHNGTKAYMIAEDGTVSLAGAYQFDANTVSGTGALLIDFTEMGWQFGSDANKSLTAVKQFIMTTNSLYNWNFEIVIGEIGYYTGTLGEDAVYHKLLDTSAGNKLAQITATSDLEANRCTVRANKVDRTQYGAVTLNWLATGKTASSFAVWDGGSYGKAEMVTDSYGDDAVRLTSTGANPKGDQYTATTIADGVKWNLTNAKGITFWARNDSDIEVSFNLEIDICNNNYTNNGKGHNARFNIKQGNRFVLYDVKTGKQTIYMTRPCATLPVGFEGWVFVPFTAFNQAEWSVSGQGAMARNLFVDDNNVFNAESWVSYIAITVHAPTYQGKAFSLNKFGSYTTTPSFVSGVIAETDTAKSVPTLMDLPSIKED